MANFSLRLALETLRKQKNVTRKEIADVLGVKPNHIDYRCRHNRIWFNDVLLLCNHYKISIKTFIKWGCSDD